MDECVYTLCLELTIKVMFLLVKDEGEENMNCSVFGGKNYLQDAALFRVVVEMGFFVGYS